MINLENEDENKSNNNNFSEDKEDNIDIEEVKENINKIEKGIKKNKISKFDLSYKSTETKNTLFQNESKFSSQ